jgi:nucleoid-associated protein YgaU
MPRLGDVTLNVVYSEDRDKKVNSTDKPIENGLNITDHTEKEPVKFKISGVCTGSDATTRLQKLETYANEGKRLTYVGRYYTTNLIIESISTRKDVEVADTAYKFDIDLKQTTIVKAAVYSNKKPATKGKTSAGKKQPASKGPSKRYYVVKKGDSLSRIAQKYYGHSTKTYYMKIYNANKKIIGSSPEKIKVGMKLLIP